MANVHTRINHHFCFFFIYIFLIINWLLWITTVRWLISFSLKNFLMGKTAQQQHWNIRCMNHYESINTKKKRHAYLKLVCSRWKCLSQFFFILFSNPMCTCSRFAAFDDAQISFINKQKSKFLLLLCFS